MKAMVFEAFGETPAIRDVPDPDGLLIEVKATGLCRSDRHGWKGHDSNIRLPHLPGHEFAGVVAAVGSGVARFRVGDRVTMPTSPRAGSARNATPTSRSGRRRPGKPGR